MPAAIESVVASAYVVDIGKSRAFYELLGFKEQSRGHGPVSAWSYMIYDRHSVLLVSTTPPLGVTELPLLFYFYVDDLGKAVEALEAGGVAITRTGNPSHARAGEVKVVDPDGNTILLGQRDGSEEPMADIEAVDDSDSDDSDDVEADDVGAPEDSDRTAARFSLLRESAAVIRRRGGAPSTCQVGDRGGTPCTRPAEVKLADSWGDSAWACLVHADEALVMARGVFLANNDDDGLAPFLGRRQRPTR